MSYQSKLVMCEMLNLLNAKDKTQLRKTQMHYIDATKKQTDLAKEYNTAKAAINTEYEYDDPQRKQALEDVKDEFEFLKAEAAAYADQAEQEVNDLNTRIDMRRTLIDNTKEEIQQEVEQDHQYGFNTTR